MEDFIANIFFTSFLCGIIFLIVAAITYYFPPKKINAFYGYRTASSMRSQERWDFAQRFSSIQMIRGSVALMLISLLGYFVPIAVEVKQSIGMGLLVLMVVYLMVTTEKAIKKEFKDTSGKSEAQSEF
ncbi:SdpI family protein [Flavobacterium sp. DGU11]|uniref:SdpI family protein n=1 Tax=Flavobacterium arundinis TaxID=3139143 RepID=A0ABU9I0S9_9FLAO